MAAARHKTTELKETPRTGEAFFPGVGDGETSLAPLLAGAFALNDSGAPAGDATGAPAGESVTPQFFAEGAETWQAVGRASALVKLSATPKLALFLKASQRH